MLYIIYRYETVGYLFNFSNTLCRKILGECKGGDDEVRS